LRLQQTNFAFSISGKISSVDRDTIVIVDAFHNGVKIKKKDAEVEIGRETIEEIEFIATIKPEAANKSVQNTPSKTETPKVINKSPFTKSPSYNNNNNRQSFRPVLMQQDRTQIKASKPIAIIGKQASSSKSTQNFSKSELNVISVSAII